MSRLIWWPLTVALLGCQHPTPEPAPPPPPPYEPFQFTLNGREVEPEAVYSLEGDPRRPRPGDVVVIDDMPIVLGAERRQQLVGVRDYPEQRLYLVQRDGSRRLVAVNVGWTFDKGQKVVRNPLAKLSAGELAALRGLVLDDWPSGIEVTLRQLDLSHVCLTITDNAAVGQKKAAPLLPDTLRYLVVRERSNMGIRDWGALSLLRSLRVLVLKVMTARPFQLRHVAQNAGLRALDISGTDVAGTGALAALADLRQLDVSWSDGISDLSFAATMRKLASLDVERTKIASLGPLGPLADLVEVNANSTPLTRLPDGPLPALRRLKLLSTRLSPPEVSRFRDAHPRCVVEHGWMALLRDTAAPADRLRVRTGGTCHRRLSTEKTIFEVRDRAEIKGLLRQIEVNEDRSGFHCMCCGSPTFELYEGSRLLVTLGFHHGQSLRWPDRWPGDATLQPESAEHLARFLGKHGFDGPLREREAERARAAAMRRRVERYRLIIPREAMVALRAARGQQQEIAAFEKITDPAQRAAVLLRLFGCDSGSWNLYAGLDRLLTEALLPALEQGALAAALKQGLNDPAVVNGAARWLLSEKKHDKVPAKALAGALPRLAGAGLASPREINRRRTIAALGRIKAPEGVRVLRELLAGKVQPASLPAEERAEAGGMVAYTPEDSAVDEACSDGAYAALVLAQLKDKRSLPRIRKLAAAASGQDKAVLQRAVDLLEGKTPEKKE